MTDCEFKYALINNDAKAPDRQPDSVGYDCYSFGAHVLNPGETKIIPLGFHAMLSPGYGCFVWDRSSFGSKGIHIFRQLVENTSLAVEMFSNVILGGVLDWSYQGQYGVILHNMGTKIFSIAHQARIAQFVIQKCELPIPKRITIEELQAIPSIRGQAGFGCSDGQNTITSAQDKIIKAATADKK